MEDILKRQEEKFDENFKYLGEDEYNLNRQGIKEWHKQSVIEILEGLKQEIEKMQPMQPEEYSAHYNNGYDDALQDTISNLENIISKLK